MDNKNQDHVRLKISIDETQTLESDPGESENKESRILVPAGTLLKVVQRDVPSAEFRTCDKLGLSSGILVKISDSRVCWLRKEHFENLPSYIVQKTAHTIYDFILSQLRELDEEQVCMFWETLRDRTTKNAEFLRIEIQYKQKVSK